MSITVFTFVILLPLALGSSSLDYTTRMIPPELAVPCTQLRIPTNFCSTCPLKPFNSAGRFEQSLDAFELSTPACQAVLAEYVSLNPCDTVRARQLANQNDTEEVRGLEIFMYSVCETCCDCIPIGSLVEEYDERKANNTLLTPLRGNCVFHYFFDACKFLPNVTDVARPTGNFRSVGTPVCNIIRQWRRRGFGMDWELDPSVEMLPKDAKRFLGRLIRFAGCKRRSIWESCVPMEQARGRL